MSALLFVDSPPFLLPSFINSTGTKGFPNISLGNNKQQVEHFNVCKIPIKSCMYVHRVAPLDIFYLKILPLVP